MFCASITIFIHDFFQIPGEMVNQVRYLYEAEMGAKKAKNIKEVKKMLGRRSKSHGNMLKDVSTQFATGPAVHITNYLLV